eukprot:TRINITY_DN5285_c0_g1_i3.p1 TRINITY_DN5285_c0_g1~~TRINITY_DN5285_c0_g1_i3.p1  ORF type:complete len:165 (-),score=31.63 TRINITY_DN5285_c0_g1_i3:103-597(-)
MGGQESREAQTRSDLRRIEKGSEVFQIYHTSPENATGKKIRFVVTSDTHTCHDNLNLPEGDVFVHCGDFTKHASSRRDLTSFNEFLGKLPYKHKLVVGGNHDFCVYHPDQPDLSKPSHLLSNATYLEDSGIEIEGIKIWGAPWTKARGIKYRAKGFNLKIIFSN